MDIEKLKYPIGKYTAPDVVTPAHISRWIAEIGSLPQRLAQVLANISAEQLAKPYRPNGWTGVQLVHHIADSHMNAYIRFKLALTEETPTIKPYEEKLWAQLPDNELPVNISLTLLHALHQRWYATIRNLTQTDWERMVVHPEHGRKMSLWFLLGMYAWHGKHHTAHIHSLRESKGW